MSENDDSWLRDKGDGWSQPLTGSQEAPTLQYPNTDEIGDIPIDYGNADFEPPLTRTLPTEDYYDNEPPGFMDFLRKPAVLIAIAAIVIFVGIFVFFHPSRQTAQPSGQTPSAPQVIVALHGVGSANSGTAATGTPAPNVPGQPTAASAQPTPLPTVAGSRPNPIPTTTAASQQPPPPSSVGTIINNVFIDWYNFDANGNNDSIAFPQIHQGATEGSGTWSDPITFASAINDDGSQGEFAPGARIYVPEVHKYFIMEDQSYQANSAWFNHTPQFQYHQVVLWMGPPSSIDGNTVLQCGLNFTQGSFLNGTGVIVANPVSSLPVDQTPLYTSNNTCSTHHYANAAP